MRTYEDIEKLIENGESHTLELKKTTGELKDAMHTVCAFLNTDGGQLVFGVAPSLKIVGQDVSDATQRELAQAIKGIEPVADIRIEYIDLPDNSGKKLIVLNCDAFVNGQHPFVFRGCPYYKVESTTMVMPRDMYDERIRANRPQLFGWDVQDAYGVDFSDLEEVRIRNAVRLGVAGGRLNASAEGDSVISLLNKFNLLNNGKLSQAAVMLFAKESRYYPQLLLRMARFRGLDKNEFIDNRQATGNFFDLLDAGMDFCFKHLNLHGKIVGVRRVETLEIPQEALREALINALCHRDYNNIHAAVSLAIYDDRVEIINPGTLPPDLSIEKLKQPHASSPHNLLIAQVLYRTTFIESWGSGVRRMTEVCAENGAKVPEFSAQNNNFAITFYRGEKSLEDVAQNVSQNVAQNVSQNVVQNDKHVAIIECIKENPQISRSQIAKKLGVSLKTVERDIAEMGDLIRYEGSAKGGHWSVGRNILAGDVSQNVAQNVSQNVAQNNRHAAILGYIKGNPYISRAQLADKLGVSIKTIERDIVSMSDIISYIGSAKGGHWQIKE